MIYTNKVMILARKELKDSFSSPLIYVLSGLFSLMMGWLFFNYLIQSSQMTTTTMTQGVITPIFGNINFIFVFLCPLITIIGKFISNVALVLFMLSLTLLFPLILSFSGYSDWGVVWSSYFGIVLSVMAFTAVGLFCSSLTDNQIVASLLTFCILLGSMLMVISINATNNYLLALIVQYTTIPFHYEGFTRGVLKSYSFIYFICYIVFFFLLTLKSLQSRKW